MKVEVLLWVLVLVSVAIALLSPKYRNHALFAGGFAVVAIVTVIEFASKNEIVTPPAPGVPVPQSKRIDFEAFHIETLDKEDPEAKTRITASEIRFDQIRASPGSQPGTIESIRARLYNTSARFTLTDFAYDLIVQDCAANACTTIYEQRGWASTAVPAGQARDVVIDIRAGENRESAPFNVPDTPKILLSPSATRAYR